MLIIAVAVVVLAVVYAHEAKMIHTFVAIASFVAGIVVRWAWVKYINPVPADKKEVK